jgi:hypothetical protein
MENRMFTPSQAAIYSTREELVANPVVTWVVVKDETANRRFPWSLRDQHGHEHERYTTKRDATATIQPGGWFADRWAQELAWFDGTTPEGWKSYATVQAEVQERLAAEARKAAEEERKIERMGINASDHTGWAKALAGDDPVALRHAAQDMFEHLSSGLLINPDQLDQQEAAGVFRELSDSWGFGTAASDWLYEVKYLGMHAGKTAVEVLEMMDREDEDARRYDLANAY